MADIVAELMPPGCDDLAAVMREMRPNGAAWEAPLVDYSPQILSEVRPANRENRGENHESPQIGRKVVAIPKRWSASSPVAKFCALCHHPFHLRRCKRCTCGE